MAFALKIISMVVLVQAFAVSELAAKPKPVTFEYKQAHFRVATNGNETFQIQNAELEHGKWYLLEPCDEATAEQIESQRINATNFALFGACGQAYIPKGITGKYRIATSAGEQIAMVNFTVPLVLLDGKKLHLTDLPTNCLHQRGKVNEPIFSSVQLINLSKDSRLKCEEGKKTVDENFVSLEVICN